MDNMLLPRGLTRASLPRFAAWIAPWIALLAVGVLATFILLKDGLYHTHMDNRFAFGLWIVFDLAVIALGAGAFFTGFLFYILKKKELNEVINTAVIVGFICYSGAMLTLAIDVGQPIRAWFPFWHANVHSMLTEVSFCISCYLVVLSIEYLPILLKNRKLKLIPSFLVFEFNLHKIMIVFAGIGAFLSFFHQGSLGGMFGVLNGRPFAFREGIGIWPTTFFLFILSAIAAGPSFLMLVVSLVSRITKKTLASRQVLAELGKISGWLMALYVIAKLLDTLLWIGYTVPSRGFDVAEFYRHEAFGVWALFLELTVFGLLPATILISRKRRQHMGWLILGGVLTSLGIVFNRYVVTLQTQSVPTLAFDGFKLYWPNLSEWAVVGMILAYGVLIYSFSYRYLPLFPNEKEMGVARVQ